MPSETNLALFDFDGTITDKDSFFYFLLFTQGGKANLIAKGLPLVPILMLYKLGLLNNGKAKQIVIAYFFKGKNKDDFQLSCEKFASEVLPTLLREKAIERIHWHLRKQDRVFIISASIEDYMRPLVENLGVELIATKLEYTNDTVSGYFSGNNCYGKEKVKRLDEILKRSDFKRIYAYGDSKGDKEMLTVADEAQYKPFL
jgi:HAD superfamily hydrolase (TIGR01490 family)